MKTTQENRITFATPEDSIRRSSLHGSPRKRMSLDVSPLRLWQILAVECILTLLLLMLIIPIVRGENQIVFTTTSDFDLGNKSDPGQNYFASNGIDQPSNWEAKPRAIFDSVSGVLYTVWQGDFSFAPVNGFNIYIAGWDQSSQRWIGPYKVNTIANPISPDGHGSPALIMSAVGYIHVFCCSHATNLLHFRSGSSRQITSGTRLPDVAFQATYPNLFVMNNGTMYLFFRLGFSHSSGWVYVLSKDNGKDRKSVV